MQEQHIRHLWSILEYIDTILEKYEMKLKLTNRSDNVLKHVRSVREEIHKFLAYLGVSEKKENIYNDIYKTCKFLEMDMVEMEPKRFQKDYGKLDSQNEENEVEKLVQSLKDKLQKLETEAAKNIGHKN